MLSATCIATNSCFCEGIRSGFFAQPVNSWSSIAFIFAGIIVIGLVGGRRWFGLLYGCTLIFIGASSFYYHASLTYLGQFLDVLATYLLITLIIMRALSLKWRWLKRWQVSLYLASNVVLATIMHLVPDVRRYLLALLLLAAVWSLFSAYRWKIWASDDRAAKSALILVLIAFFLWVMDNTRVWCSPMNVIQGHALWHILTAIAAIVCYFSFQNREARI